MKLEYEEATLILNKLLSRATPVLEAGTPEEMYYMTGAIKNILTAMAPKEEK
jgi:hypothetical protein